MRPDWLPDWTGEVCAIVAGGESVTQYDVDLLRGRCRVAVVNNSFRLAPWGDLLYACDKSWWDLHFEETKIFAGTKLTHNRDVARYRKIGLVDVYPKEDPRANCINIDPLGTVGGGGNGGFQLTNIVIQSGVRRIIGLGFDFCGSHWHGNHPPPMKNPKTSTLKEWRQKFDAISGQMQALGVQFVNVSDRSELTAYRKADLCDVLAEWTKAA